MAIHRLRYRDSEKTVTVKKVDGVFEVSVDGCEVTVTKKGAGYVVSDGSRECFGEAAQGKSRLFVTLDSRLMEFDLVGADSVSSGGDSSHAGEQDKLRAPMPGKIVKILVEQGAIVKAKQPLVVIESMKMENQLLSPSAGVIKAIHFDPGEQVDTDEVIVELDIA